VTLAEVPDYLLRPQYQTCDQKKIAAMEQNLADLTAVLKDMQKDRVEDRKTFDSIRRALEANTEAVMDFTSWKPQVDTKVDDLKTHLESLRDQVDRLCLKTEEFINPSYKCFDEEHLDLTKPAAAHLVAPSTEAASGPDGHRDAHDHRGTGRGVVTTFVPSPVTGAKQIAPISFSLIDAPESPSSNQSWSALLPQLSFPSFDGSNPKIWKKKCENFFDIYAIPAYMWVKLSTMYFTGSAAFWLQAMETKFTSTSWDNLCQAVCSCFEREQHNQLIRQFFHVRQSGSVAEYVE